MDVEELQIRMGMKTDEVLAGFGRIFSSVGHFREEMEEAGFHVEGVGKTFKKALHAISDESPLLGTAIRMVLDPVVGSISGAVQVFKLLHTAIKAFEQELDEAAERMAKPFANVREAILKAREALAGKTVAIEERQRQLETGKPGEAESEALRKRIEAAKEVASGNEAAFLREKMRLELAAKADADRRFAAGKEKEHALELEELDVRRETRRNTRKEELKNTIEDQDRLTKEIKKQADVVSKMEKAEAAAQDARVPLEFGHATAGAIHVGMAGITTTAGEREKLEALQSDKARAEVRRKQLEEDAVAEARNEKVRANAIHDARADTDAAREAGKNLDKEAATTKAALEKAEQEQRKKDLAERIAMANTEADGHKLQFAERKLSLIEEARLEAEKNGHKEEAAELTKDESKATEELRNANERQAKDQAKFDRDIKLARERRESEALSPYLPTLQKIAQSAAWDPGLAAEAAFQRSTDAMRRRAGMTYAAQFAPTAQELEMRKADLAEAIEQEGPMSKRAKADLERIQSLKDTLVGAGLMKSDTALESIDNHIAALLERAAGEGLIVQPVNGQ